MHLTRGHRIFTCPFPVISHADFLGSGYAHVSNYIWDVCFPDASRNYISAFAFHNWLSSLQQARLGGYHFASKDLTVLSAEMEDIQARVTFPFFKWKGPGITDFPKDFAEIV